MGGGAPRAETPPTSPPPRISEDPSTCSGSSGSSYQHMANGSSTVTHTVTNGRTVSGERSVIVEALQSTSSVLEGGLEGGEGRGEGGGQEGGGEGERLDWLQRQQVKLQERREGARRTRQESAVLIHELQSSLHRARSGGTETTDGWVVYHTVPYHT